MLRRAEPQKAGTRQDEGVGADELGAANAEVDGQSLSGSSPARSEGQRSFSVRSRSPPLQVDSFAGSVESGGKSRDSMSVIDGMPAPSSSSSLFKNCFSGKKPPSTSPAPFLVVPESVDASMSGEDVE